MIPELLLSLVGFTGGVIIEDNSTFVVNMSFDMVTEAEKEQINKIAPLGWYYRELSKYAGIHGARWGSKSNQIYKSAFCLAISDILEQYKADVTALESKFSSEGPFPLSHLIYQLQKYSLALPAAHNCCNIVESKKIRGCQFLDFLANYRTGVPTVSDVINRLLCRVRVVFLKQCLSWVLHGELEDPDKEFFIQMRADRPDPTEEYTGDIPALGAGSFSLHGRQPFDWTGTYTLRLEMLPESHVTPRLAAKILFCGKAVRMLRETATELHRLDTLDAGVERSGKAAVGPMAMGSSVTNPVGAIYSYLSSGGGAVSSGVDDLLEGTDAKDITLEGKIRDVSLAEEEIVFIKNVISQNAQKSGYTLGELEMFSRQFHNIVNAIPSLFVGCFEGLIESVTKTISCRLWLLLKDRFGFVQFLVGLRNTYLIGKGELFQLFLDGILKLMDSPPPNDSQVDALLTWDVLRSAAKLLNLDDDVMAETLKLRVNSPSISVVDFGLGDIIRRHGTFALGDMGDTRHRHIYLGMLPGSTNSGEPTRGYAPRVSVASVPVPSGDAVGESTTPDPKSTTMSGALNYTSGAVTIHDEKYVLKGFTTTCLFSCEWNEITKHLNPTHPILPRSVIVPDNATVHPDITLGTMMCALHDAPFVVHGSGGTMTPGVHTVGTPYGIAATGGAMRTIGAGVSIHARVVSVGTDKIDYFAKVFLWTSTPPSGGSSVGSVGSPGGSTAGRRFGPGSLNGHVVASSGEIPLVFGVESLDSVEDRNKSIMQATATFALDIEYYRDMTRMSDADIMSVGRASTSSTSTTPGAPKGTGSSSVINGIRARLRARNSIYSIAPVSSWDVDTVLDIGKHMRLLGGQCNVSVVGSGLYLPATSVLDTTSRNSGINLFNFNMSAFSFLGKGSSLSTYPVASSATATRFPPTFSWLDSRMSQYRAWMNLKLNFKFPRVFGIVVDHDAVSAYSRIFSSLIKVRLVVHAFERLWLARSGLDTDRLFCHLRHAMHFFNSNLLYHLQVDVIDTEFSVLMTEVRGAVDFQSVLRAHKNFVASIVRMSHIDNNVVQDAIERVLQICLRFLAVSSLHQHNEDILQASVVSSGPVGEVFYLPQEEFGAIQKDFFAQVSYLLQLMKKIENRGFVFRVDFNGFFSQLSHSSHAAR